MLSACLTNVVLCSGVARAPPANVSVGANPALWGLSVTADFAGAKWPRGLASPHRLGTLGRFGHMT